MELSRRVEYYIFLIYQKLTVQDFNFQLFGILRVSTLRFGGSPLLYFIFRCRAKPTASLVVNISVVHVVPRLPFFENFVFLGA